MDKKYQSLSTKLMYDMVENLRLTNIKKNNNPTKTLNYLVQTVNAGGTLLVMTK